MEEAWKMESKMESKRDEEGCLKEQKIKKDEKTFHNEVHASRKEGVRQNEETAKETPPLCRLYFRVARDWMKEDS